MRLCRIFIFLFNHCSSIFFGHHEKCANLLAPYQDDEQRCGGLFYLVYRLQSMRTQGASFNHGKRVTVRESYATAVVLHLSCFFLLPRQPHPYIVRPNTLTLTFGFVMPSRGRLGPGECSARSDVDADHREVLSLGPAAEISGRSCRRFGRCTLYGRE